MIVFWKLLLYLFECLIKYIALYVSELYVSELYVG